MTAARRVMLWLPVVALCAAIFAVSSIPDDRVLGGAPLPETMGRKLGHLVEYGLLAALFARALKGEGRPPKVVFWASLLFCFLYAASDEFHQTFVKGRYGKVRDVALDTLGAALALSVLRRRDALQEKP